MSDLLNGTAVGPYRVVAKLGAGAMGTVFRAVVEGSAPLPPGERVALKFVHAHLSDTDSLLRRFELEATVGKRVDHPNVVRTYDASVLRRDDRDLPYLVMEYVEGQTLKALLAELGRVPEELCRHVAREVTAGLAAIHESGAIHRDLKPENILITPDHAIKVMDFGMARVAEMVGISQTGAFAGSLLYAAPEQLGLGSTLDGRVDLHALGLILYELATGAHPFASTPDIAPAQLVQRVLEEVPRPLGERNPQSSPFLEELVHTLLAKDCDDRFQSARELLQVLTEGEETEWWKERARALRTQTRRPLRRVRVPREASLHGRATDLERLEHLYALAKAGQGQVVLIEGEAGIGKTRLVDEFVASLSSQGEDLNFLFGSFPPGGAATAASAFAEAYREHIGTENLEEVLAAHLTAIPRFIPAFSALLRGDARPADAAPLTPESLQTSFVHTTRALARERATIILIDDLHFAPVDGHALFTALAFAAANERVLLVGTLRPDGHANWLTELLRQSQVSHLPLDRLGTRELSGLVTESLGSPQAVSRELLIEISRKADGNPFFLFEILRGLRQSEFLRPAVDGTWQPAGAITAIAIPSSVKELIEARIRGLTDRDREVLEVAACAGFEFDPLLVGEAIQASRIPLLKHLAQLERTHRVIRAVGRGYVFDHHQVQEALYEQLPDLLRESYHAELALALERQTGAAARDPEQLDGRICFDLCSHFLRSGQGQQALRYLPAALDFLDERNENGAAIALADHALRMEGLLRGRERANILLRKWARLDPLGRTAEQELVLMEAQKLAEEDFALSAQVHTQLGRHFWRTARYDEACKVLQKALELARTANAPNLEGAAHRTLGIVLHELGRCVEARAHHEKQIAIARECGATGDELGAMCSLAIVLRDLGCYAEARTILEEHLARTAQLSDRRMHAIGVGTMGTVLRESGRFDEARPYLEQHLALAFEAGDRRLEASASGNLGFVLIDLGQYTEARGHVEHQIALAREAGDRRNIVNGTGTLGTLALAMGDYDDALAHFNRSLTLARDIGLRRAEVQIRILLARIYSRLGALENAQEAIDGVDQLCRDMGIHRLSAVALIEQGAIADRSGDVPTAERSYRTAFDRLQAIGNPLGNTTAMVALGALLARNTRTEEALAIFREVLAKGIETSPASDVVLAATHCALLGPSESESPVALARRLWPRLGAYEKMEAAHLLWQATQDSTWLEEAHRLLLHLHEHAPAQHRTHMLDKVPLHRVILADWRSAVERNQAPDRGEIDLEATRFATRLVRQRPRRDDGG